MTRVVDTSVVLAWYVAEEGSAAAANYLGQSLVAPGLMWSELANALWKKVRRREIDALQAAAALADAETAVNRLDEQTLVSRALEIGCALDHPVYDCVFLALAEAVETRVVTADKRLVEACGGTSYRELLEVVDV
ncbi:type II toxin-antitoxin system VapC family toxin [Sphingomonas lenta]|uniref:type II toxin-antitoxin system VapC family toxin n=1 Tax=Sphingomonas lenta TaxID=1141887 RepID=UPI001594F0FC|nr:type II toxin-antitoxin system VapC family toxin [Sphingomonas lenta]